MGLRCARFRWGLIAVGRIPPCMVQMGVDCGRTHPPVHGRVTAVGRVPLTAAAGALVGHLAEASSRRGLTAVVRVPPCMLLAMVGVTAVGRVPLTAAAGALVGHLAEAPFMVQMGGG